MKPIYSHQEKNTRMISFSFTIVLVMSMSLFCLSLFFRPGRVSSADKLQSDFTAVLLLQHMPQNRHHQPPPLSRPCPSSRTPRSRRTALPQNPPRHTRRRCLRQRRRLKKRGPGRQLRAGGHRPWGHGRRPRKAHHVRAAAEAGLGPGPGPGGQGRARPRVAGRIRGCGRSDGASKSAERARGGGKGYRGDRSWRQAIEGIDHSGRR